MIPNQSDIQKVKFPQSPIYFSALLLLRNSWLEIWATPPYAPQAGADDYGQGQGQPGEEEHFDPVRQRVSVRQRHAVAAAAIVDVATAAAVGDDARHKEDEEDEEAQKEEEVENPQQPDPCKRLLPTRGVMFLPAAIAVRSSNSPSWWWWWGNVFFYYLEDLVAQSHRNKLGTSSNSSTILQK